MIDLKNAQQRIEGSWQLASFQPEAPLGQPFDALVAAQVGQLQLTLSGGTLEAIGVGLQATRRYEILKATPDTAQGAIIDDVGVRYDFDVAFQGDQLVFFSKSSPWRGRGTLARVHQ